jgi:predicted dehydrogenase
MRLAIVGAGAVGRKRVAAARACGFPVVAVADADPARAAELASVAGARACSWREAVADGDADAVIVATSHDALAEVALAAVTAGRNLLLEKPAARSAAELRPLLQAARERGRVVRVGYNHRFHPALAKARALVADGVAGPLMYVRGRYGHGGRPGMEAEWRCRPELSGGGELIDQGSHLIDLTRWFLGDVLLDYGSAETLYWDCPADDNCFMALRGQGGQPAWLHASWSEWKNLFSFEIAGRDAKLTIDGLGGSYGTERLTLHRMLPEMGPPETTIWEYPFPDRSWELELRAFAAAADGQGADLDDAVAVLDIIDRVYGR